MMLASLLFIAAWYSAGSIYLARRELAGRLPAWMLAGWFFLPIAVGVWL